MPLTVRGGKGEKGESEPVGLRYVRLRTNMEFWSGPGFTGVDLGSTILTATPRGFGWVRGLTDGDLVTLVGEIREIDPKDCEGVGEEKEPWWTVKVIVGDVVGYLTGDATPHKWMYEVNPESEGEE